MMSDPTSHRQFIPFGEQKTMSAFSVVSYNILADMFLGDGDYDLGFHYLTEDMKDPKQRHERLMKELVFLDGDIVCLQEVEEKHYDGDLMRDMKELGYEGTLALEEDWAEGAATFFKSERFELLDNKKIYLKNLCYKAAEEKQFDLSEPTRQYLNQHGVLNCVKLRCKLTKHSFVIGNCHVFWGEERTEYDTQTLQIAQMIKFLESYGDKDCPMITCGDFNTEPHMPAYNMIIKGDLSVEGVKEMKTLNNVDVANNGKKPLIDILPLEFFQHKVPLQSAFLHTQGSEPVTYAGDHFFGTLDYICYDSRSFKTAGVLMPVNYTQKQAVPNEFLSSDHLSIKTILDFV